MNRPRLSQRRGIRRSCERCRQKKVKCSAEKPECSFCHRLKQTCIYLPRNVADGSVRASNRETNGDSQDGPFPRPNVQSSALAIHDDNAQSLLNKTWLPSDPEPPPEVLDYFANIYRNQIYFQPLPLFNISGLKEQLLSFPYYLRWSFLALVLHYSTHSFYLGKESEAIELYTTACRSVVMDQSMDGVVKIEVLQSLCLLALCEVKKGQHARAWMAIGSVSRLEALRLSPYSCYSCLPRSTDSILRCHWSIFTLEKTFTPHLARPGLPAGRLSFPQSVDNPNPLDISRAHKSYCPELSNDDEVHGHSIGINACCLEVLSVWGDIVAYLHEVRCGLVDYPWLPTSRHTQLVVAVYEIETKSANRHMLRHASFPDRSPSDVSSQREYWTPWLVMQILFHASQAALNNPFVQLVALRGSKDKIQPQSFLQKMVDQALFNYEWVARLVQMAEDASLQIYDPLIGYAVAATATVPWLFQFARDEEASGKARENLDLFEGFLGHLSLQWPHLAHKLKIFRELKSLGSDRGTEAQSTTIRFQPELLWDLLGPGISLPIDGSGPKIKHSHPLSSKATLHVTTRYVHPITERQASERSVTEALDMNFQRSLEGFDAPFLDDFFSDTLLEGVF